MICPSCLLHLSVRAATVGPKNPEDPKATPRKVVYLHCLMCRWSSRDVGIPDQIAGKTAFLCENLWENTSFFSNWRLA